MYKFLVYFYTKKQKKVPCGMQKDITTYVLRSDSFLCLHVLSYNFFYALKYLNFFSLVIL